MKHLILGLAFSAVSSLPALAGPLVGGGGGGVHITIQSSEKNSIILEAGHISDIRLKDENIVRFEELLQNPNLYNIKALSKRLYQVNLSGKSEIADIQLIDGSIIRGDLGGGGTVN